MRQKKIFTVSREFLERTLVQLDEFYNIDQSGDCWIPKPDPELLNLRNSVASLLGKDPIKAAE